MALHSYGRDMKTSGPKARPIMIDRVQALVLAFFLMARISLVAILVAAPEVYERRLRSLPGAQRIVDVVFVVALTAFIVFLSIGVLRRWRWAFWLILIAFLLGVLRVPVAVLQLSGQMTPDGPTWYVILQGVIRVAQVLIVLAMILAYRPQGSGDREVAEAHKSRPVSLEYRTPRPCLGQGLLPRRSACHRQWLSC
jgi:cell division protein FtsW (lipid II flippase)